MYDEVIQKEKITIFKALDFRYKYFSNKSLLYILIYGSLILIYGSLILIIFLIYNPLIKHIINYILIYANHVAKKIYILSNTLLYNLHILYNTLSSNHSKLILSLIILILSIIFISILLTVFAIILKTVLDKLNRLATLSKSLRLQYIISYKIDKKYGITHLTTYDPNNNNYIILSLTYPAIITASFKMLYHRLSSYVYLFYLIKKRPIFSLLVLFPELLWFMLYIFLLRYVHNQHMLAINILLIVFLMVKMYKFCREYLYRLSSLYQLMLAIEDINFNLGNEFEHFLNSVVIHGYEDIFKSLINNLKIFLPF